MDKAQSRLLSQIGQEDLEKTVSYISKRYNVCILITDSQGNTLYSSDIGRNCTIHKLKKESLAEKYLEICGKGNSGQSEYTEDTEQHENIIKINAVKGYSSGGMLVIIESALIPLDSTIYSLRMQIICMSVVMVVMSMITAFILSKKISGSIVEVSAAAAELIKGNYNVEFKGRDYREISELTDALNKAAMEMSKADTIQKELIANVSHDLRTPLTMIIGYAEVMRDIPGENTPENVQVIIDETTRLTALVNDMLDISKVNAGVTKLETKIYDLTESIASITERNSKLVEPYGYRLIFDYKCHVYVDADEFKMYQVIYNLISNAINYSGREKHIYIRQKAAGGKVRIEVEDTGPGIPEDELDYIWERYYKIDKNHKRAVVGTGLGLSIAGNILKLHGAEFGVQSEMGKGSLFWFQMDIFDKSEAK